MRPIVILAAFWLGACATQPPPPPARTQVGWKKMDGSVATGTLLEQSTAICHQQATASGNPYSGPLFVQFMAMDATLKGCMAQRGYLPVMSE